MICARSFGAVLELPDIDVSIFQDAVSSGTTAPILHLAIPNAVAHLSDMMTEEQRNWRGFERWYRVMMDFVVFGTEEEPIEVEE
jgi:hypothetical protein